MALTDILVPLQFSPCDAPALDAAAALARGSGGTVIVLATVAYPMPVVSEWGLAVLAPDGGEFAAARAVAAEAVAAAGERLQRADVRFETRLVDSLLAWPEENAAMHARHADLSVLGRPADPGASPRFEQIFGLLLMETGRPALLVPPAATLPERVGYAVLGWHPHREAARAVHDALPLLAEGARLDVLVIDPVVGEQHHGEQPGADIARHLVRHGLQVRVVALPRQGRTTGDSLAQYAAEQGADLLVMGGFGHSRLRQRVLGGATRDVLLRASVPVLFAH